MQRNALFFYLTCKKHEREIAISLICVDLWLLVKYRSFNEIGLCLEKIEILLTTLHVCTTFGREGKREREIRLCVVYDDKNEHTKTLCQGNKKP